MERFRAIWNLYPERTSVFLTRLANDDMEHTLSKKRGDLPERTDLGKSLFMLDCKNGPY